MIITSAQFRTEHNRLLDKYGVDFTNEDDTRIKNMAAIL